LHQVREKGEQDMYLRRMNPWTTFSELHREIDRLFDSVTGDQAGLSRPTAFPALNVWEDESSVHAEAELPGVKQGDLEVYAQDNELTIKGHRQPRDGENLLYHRRERGMGEFTRVVTLPVEVETGKVEASLTDGVLTVKMPKAEQAKPRKVLVKVG